MSAGPMRVKFGFRARFRLNRRSRGYLPLQRVLFHRLLRRVPARKALEMLGEQR